VIHDAVGSALKPGDGSDLALIAFAAGLLFLVVAALFIHWWFNVRRRRW
jgi:hypothetical protein